jgi:UDP-glucose 4-epimerase
MQPPFDLSEPKARKPARAVVLGANGFIGGAVLRALHGAAVETASLGRPGLDLLRPEAVDQLAGALRADDALVFVSAKAPCKNSEMLLENLAMVRTVCATLQRRSVAHVVYISSDAVYKDSPHALSETSCAEPGSLHGAMHLAREIALRSEFAGPLTVVRPTLVYGLDDPHNGYGPNRFRRLAAAGQDIVLFGEGEERRDHVDVEDVAALVVRILLHRAGGIVNAVSGEVVSFRELAEFAATEFSPRVVVKGSPRSGPMPHNGYRPFERSAAERMFPGFRFRSWAEGLARVHAQQRAA